MSAAAQTPVTGLLTETADYDTPGSWGRASVGWPEVKGDQAYAMYVFANCVQSVPYGSYVLVSQRGQYGATESVLRVHAQHLAQLQKDYAQAGAPDVATSIARREQYGNLNPTGNRESAPLWTANTNELDPHELDIEQQFEAPAADASHHSKNGATNGLPFGIIDPDYARIFTKARILAWQYGYALVMHGSFTRDLDLLLVPWEDRAFNDAVKPIVNMLAEQCGLTIREGDPTAKPHGRTCWSLHLPGFGEPRWVDLSVMPCSTSIATATETLPTPANAPPLADPVALLTVPPSGTGLVVGLTETAHRLPPGEYSLFADEWQATCSGCGCTDDRACAGGCSWLAVDRVARTGICSNCPAALQAWKNQRPGA